MVWLAGAGALEVLEALMGAGRGRILGQVQRVSSDKWCMLQERVIVFVSGTILGVGIFLYRTSFRICLLALCLKKLKFLTWLFLH